MLTIFVLRDTKAHVERVSRSNGAMSGCLSRIAMRDGVKSQRQISATTVYWIEVQRSYQTIVTLWERLGAHGRFWWSF